MCATTNPELSGTTEYSPSSSRMVKVPLVTAPICAPPKSEINTLKLSGPSRFWSRIKKNVKHSSMPLVEPAVKVTDDVSCVKSAAPI